MTLEFWTIPLWIAAALLVGYLGFELGRLSQPKPETPSPANPAKPKLAKPKPELGPEPEPEAWVPSWLWEWAKSIQVKPQDLDDLYQWGLTLAQLAFTQFGGGVSAKCHLHPLVRADRDNSDYEGIPAKWRSVRALERLQQAWRRAGLVQMPNQRKGLILTEAGIDQLQADPERWYP